MTLREIMSCNVIRVDGDETAAVAARMLEHYNIGMLPICDNAGKLKGVVTDRDLVTRCMAAGKKPEETKIREIMTANVVTVNPEMETSDAARLMGTEQIRRLPVVKNGKLQGIISLGDLAQREESGMETADALSDICCSISRRGK